MSKSLDQLLQEFAAMGQRLLEDPVTAPLAPKSDPSAPAPVPADSAPKPASNGSTADLGGSKVTYTCDGNGEWAEAKLAARPGDRIIVLTLTDGTRRGLQGLLYTVTPAGMVGPVPVCRDKVFDPWRRTNA